MRRAPPGATRGRARVEDQTREELSIPLERRAPGRGARGGGGTHTRATPGGGRARVARRRGRECFPLAAAGFDPDLPVLDGDWRLNPGTGLGVSFHPSQPTPNEWADFGDVDRAIFDFSASETVEPDSGMRADVTAGTLADMHNAP